MHAAFVFQACLQLRNRHRNGQAHDARVLALGLLSSTQAGQRVRAVQPGRSAAPAF